MVSQIRKIFDHASLEQKLMALVSSILCLTLGTVLLLGFHFINRQYTETVYQSMAASSRLISVSLETHLQDALQLTDVIRTDSSLQRHLDLIHKNEDYLTAGSGKPSIKPCRAFISSTNSHIWSIPQLLTHVFSPIRMAMAMIS